MNIKHKKSEVKEMGGGGGYLHIQVYIYYIEIMEYFYTWIYVINVIHLPTSPEKEPIMDQTTYNSNGKVCFTSILRRHSESYHNTQRTPLFHSEPSVMPTSHTPIPLVMEPAPSGTCSFGKNLGILEKYSWKGTQDHVIGNEIEKSRVR